MADMKHEFEKLGGKAIETFSDFVKFFTVKRVLTLLIVTLALLVVCNPTDVPVTANKEPVECDGACPMPLVINVPTITITEVKQENWQFDLLDEGWEDRELSTPNAKAVKVNKDKECKLFLLKEPSNDTLSQHVVGTLRGFTEHSINVDSVRFVIINGNKYIGSLLTEESNTIWIWMTVKDSFAYTFVCGCADNVVGSKVCPDTVESLQIK